MKLSSILKSRKFDNGTKMIAVAPHHLIYTYLIYSYKALDIVKLVWAIVLSVPKAMREPENEIRQYVPHLFYCITVSKGNKIPKVK